MIEQRRSAQKRYQNHRNSENYNTWINTAELADASLVNDHCIKRVRIRSYSGPYFPAFGVNTGNAGKYGPE